jgi:hypothetical protein
MSMYDCYKPIVFISYQANRARPDFVENIKKAPGLKVIELDINTNVAMGYAPQTPEVMKMYLEQSNFGVANHMTILEDCETGDMAEAAKSMGVKIIDINNIDEHSIYSYAFHGPSGVHNKVA